MCYDRRSFTSDEHKKASAGASPSKERDSKRQDVVDSLLRDARKTGEKADTGAAASKEYIPAK